MILDRSRWLGIIAMILAGTAAAQSYPNRAVRVIVPFAGGGGAPDVVGRVISPALSAQTGQPFVVENRAGANGIIGTEMVAKSAPDGHTLLVVSTSFAVNPSMYKKLPYDPLNDLVAISNICDIEGLFVVTNPNLPVKNLQELIAIGKKGEPKLAYASPGIGNSLHMAAAVFVARTGVQSVHVPYKGAGPAVAGLIGGETQWMFITPPLGLPQIKSGKLRGIGYSARNRASYLPEVPTLIEGGLNMAFDGGWFGLFAASNTPPAIVAKLHSELKIALANPEVKERLGASGLRVVGSAPAEFKTFLQAQIKEYAEIVKLAAIEPE